MGKDPCSFIANAVIAPINVMHCSHLRLSMTLITGAASSATRHIETISTGNSSVIIRRGDGAFTPVNLS